MEKFNKIVADIFKIPVGDIQDTLTTKDIPDWDSMNYLLLIAELEKEFNVSFDMDDVLKGDSLGAIKNVIRSKGVTVWNPVELR